MVYYSGDARAGDLSYVRSVDHGATWSAAIAVNEPGSAIAAGTIRGAGELVFLHGVEGRRGGQGFSKRRSNYAIDNGQYR